MRLKYTPERGQVRLTAEPGAKEGSVRLAVADSGIGVAAGDRDRIFEPFHRAAAARDSARQGVGLGLAFVRSMVASVGGSVTVGKADLGGAEFVVELPVVEPPAAAEGRPGGRRPAMRVVIIGGVTAGPKAAAKIIRLMPDTDVTIVERGSILSYAGCGLPSYVSGVVRSPRSLISSAAGVVRDPIFFRDVMNVHVLNQTEALEVDRAAKQVRVREAASGRESLLPYDKLLIATGATPVVPPNLDVRLRHVFTLHGVRDAEGIRTALADGRAHDVVIVGGGLIGIEMTEALVSRGARVTVVEQLPHILPMLDPDLSCLVEKHLEGHGVRIVANARVEALEGREAVSAVVTDRGTYSANLVILACGTRPDVHLARHAGLAIGSTGAILVDPGMRTSDPDIYAAGDCVEAVHRLTGRPCYIPLGSTATKQGRVAAVNLCGGSDVFPGVLGSCICSVFGYGVGRTGLGEAEARELGHDVVTVLAPGPDREHFMPTAGLLLLKLIVDRGTRRLLGAQAVGPGAVDKRIDVVSMALMSGLTVDELAHADLCYAPAFSTAMDSIITAANIARNKLAGHMEGIAASEVEAMIRRRDDFLFLDVRTPEEHEQVHLPNSVLIPLGSLRGRLGELPKEKPIVAFCDISLRGYEAALLLKAAGFASVRVMDGGIAMWPFEKLQ